MENKDRLDEFLQRKFAEDQPEQRLAFREEHWLQAQALIEAQERKRRRGFWWWWLGAGLLALLLAGWWFFAEGGLQPQRFAGTANVPARDSAKTTIGSEIPGNQDAGLRKPERLAAVHGVGEQTEKRAPFATKDFSEKQKFPEQARSATPVETRGGNVNPKQFFEKNAAAGTDPVHALPPEKTAANTAANSPDVDPELLQPGIVPAPENPVSENTAQVGWTDLDQLSLPFPLLEQALPNLEPLPLAPPPAAAPERLRTWRWQLGLAAVGGSALGHLENERTGFGAGLSARLNRRGKPYSFNADLIWRFRPGALSDTTLGTVEQLKYSFGYTLDQTSRRVAGTHWLELPLYLQYHLNVINFEAGLMPSLLLFVQGRQETTRQSSLAPEPIVLENTRTRLENRWFARLHAGAFAGVEWQPTDQLHLGLRMHYQPGRILTGSLDTPIPKRSAVWMDLRVRCLFGGK